MFWAQVGAVKMLVNIDGYHDIPICMPPLVVNISLLHASSANFSNHQYVVGKLYWIMTDIRQYLLNSSKSG